MPININNPEADSLTRKFATMTGASITEAIVVAMKEAIARRRAEESPQQTAARLRDKYGVTTSAKGKKKLPKAVFDEMWDDTIDAKS
ncbi:MAG: type II toxin-antitoxin system VapB family antitoxin [Gemmatimonadaceae bacterium]